MARRRYVPNSAQIGAAVATETAAILAAEAIRDAQERARETLAAETQPIEMPWVAAAKFAAELVQLGSQHNNGGN